LVCYSLLWLVFSGFCDDPSVCDDFTPSTCDACSEVSGCSNFECDDNNVCTDDFCDSTGCLHTPVVCDDSNPFTCDSCDPTEGCISTSCDDVISIQSLDAGDITTDTLTITGSKKRGLSQTSSLTVNGPASFTGGLTTNELSTTTLVTNTVMVTGSLMIVTSDGGSSNFDLSKGISTADVNCTALNVAGTSTLKDVNSDKLTTKDANVTGTLDLTVMKFNTLQDKLWWNMPAGHFFSLPDPTNGFKIYAVGRANGIPKLLEIPFQTAIQFGKKGQPCFLGQCQTGTCETNGVCK